MTSLEPLEPVIPEVRRPTRPGNTLPDKDPRVHARKSILTVGNCILAVLMITFGLYATGNLPQLDQAFDGFHANLQSHNDTVVRTTIHFGPLLLIGFIALIVLTFSVLRFFVRPARVSDAMDWHSKAVAERALKARKAQPPDKAATTSAKLEANTFFRPLHKQSKLRRAVVEPQGSLSMSKAGTEKNGTQPLA